MKRVAMLCWTLAACSSGGGGNGATGIGGPADLAIVNHGPSWSLNGTVDGYSLPTAFTSVEAHTLVGGGTMLVQLWSHGDLCAALQQSASCAGAGQLLSFRIGGTAPGTFNIVDKDAIAAGQARMLLVDLDSTCFENTAVGARTGTVVVSANDVATGGSIAFTFDVNTPNGPASGQVIAPACVF